MKQFWIACIVAGGLLGCGNGPKNARDTIGYGSGGTAGGSLPVPAETAGMSGGGAQPPSGAGTNEPGSAAGATTTPSLDTTHPDSSKPHKSSRKHSSR
jgi:hypothetical protein